MGNFVSQGGAQRCGQVQTLRLVRHRLQDGLGWASMPDLGRTRRRYIKKGEVWLKPFCTTEGKTFSPVGAVPRRPEISNSFSSLPSHCHFVARSGIVHLHSLPCGKERSKKTPQRALPFGFPWCWAEAIDISAPRQKCLSTFFLGCENDLRESNFRVGKSKDSPPTRVH